MLYTWQSAANCDLETLYCTAPNSTTLGMVEMKISTAEKIINALIIGLAVLKYLYNATNKMIH